MEIEKLHELIKILENSSLSEIEIEEGGRRIKLRKPKPEVISTAQVLQALPQQIVDPVAAPAQPVAAESAEPPAEADDPNLTTIKSPMVGVFYAAPAPGDPNFVSVGDEVDADKTICIVEAMKLMNEVTAKISGTIVKCLVENGEPVEFGQPLFTMRTE
jgi:acetyl-CoA carboxylase biotin carboxyl carrier protein